MATKTMSESQIQAFTRAMEVQGVRVKRVKNGLLLHLPDGNTQTKHFTTSDYRGDKNFIAALRRAGITVPGERVADLPAYITSGTITDKSKDRLHNYVVSRGYPKVVYAAEVVRDLEVDAASVNRWLYHSGFEVGDMLDKKKGRPWFTPDHIMREKITEPPSPPHNSAPSPAKIAADLADRAARNGSQVQNPEPKPEPIEEAVNPTRDEAEVQRLKDMAQPEPYKNSGKTIEEAADPEWLKENTTVEPTFHCSICDSNEHDDLGHPHEPVPVATEQPEEDITLIDERDSWVVDLDTLLGEHLSRMVKERLSVLRAVGISYEMRVWRDQ